MQLAVVTGASRGLGREVCRQLAEQGWTVLLTARGEGVAEEVARQLDHPRVEGHRLDVTEPDEANALAAALRERHGRLDALVNNAGAIFDAHGVGVLGGAEAIQRSLHTNTMGAVHVTAALAPLLVETGGGCIVNVSSGMGALTDMGTGHPGYRLSKAAMNALTKVLAGELRGSGVRVNSVCPGWVATDMGGPNATRTVEEGASGIVWAATLGPDGPTGGFFRNGQPIDL